MTPEFAERFHARRAGEGRWMARCPAHEDGTASLSIKAGDDGKVVLHCFAGCEPEDVVDAAGLKMADLFVESRRERHSGRPRRPRALARARSVKEYLRRVEAGRRRAGLRPEAPRVLTRRRTIEREVATRRTLRRRGVGSAPTPGPAP